MFPWPANMGHSVTSVSTRHKSSVIKWSAWGFMVNGRWNSVWLSLREQAQAFKDQDFSCTISGRLVKKKTGRRAFCGLDVGPNTYDGPCVSPKTLHSLPVPKITIYFEKLFTKTSSQISPPGGHNSRRLCFNAKIFAFPWHLMRYWSNGLIMSSKCARDLEKSSCEGQNCRWGHGCTIWHDANHKKGYLQASSCPKRPFTWWCYLIYVKHPWTAGGLSADCLHEVHICWYVILRAPR